MTAKVQPIRPAAPRSPERARLAAAIERHTTAADRLARIVAAEPRAMTAIFEAQHAVDAAEAAVAEARLAEPRRLATKLIGDPDDGGRCRSVIGFMARAAGC
jgi:hypothetical protein